MKRWGKYYEWGETMTEMPERGRLWKCKECGELWTEENDAVTCCSIEAVYPCKTCKKFYDDENLAAACCMESEACWVCRECGDGHVVQADAIACCACNNGLADEEVDDEEEET